METVAQAGRLSRRHKTGIRYAVVDPILWALGWRTWLPWECQPHYDRGRRGTVDYALFDSHGDVAVLIQVQNARTRRRHDRIRLWEYTRGMTHGVAVLTYGFYWEVYDLSRAARNIEDKRVAQTYSRPSGGSLQPQPSSRRTRRAAIELDEHARNAAPAQ